MKIIKNEYASFDDNNDPVATEKIIYNTLLKEQDTIPDNFNYVDLPIADTINKRGLPYTQEIITNIEKRYPHIIKKYVCQHIYVNHLQFYNNKVYTPHTLLTDTKIVIPHYNPVINEDDYISFENRKYKASFIGALTTHHLRLALTQFNNNTDIIVRETGSWHFSKKDNDRQKYANKYKEILCNTKFSLCPPGTGVSTIRLYESMAAGSIPVVFNDIKVPKIVEKYIIRLYNIEDILNIQWNDPKYINHSQDLKKYYWEYLSNTNFYKLLYD